MAAISGQGRLHWLIGAGLCSEPYYDATQSRCPRFVLGISIEEALISFQKDSHTLQLCGGVSNRKTAHCLFSEVVRIDE